MMKPKSFLAYLICFVVTILFWIPSANAVLFEYEFEGDITYAFDNSGTIDFSSTSTYFGTLSYETSGASDTTWDPTWGNYDGVIQEFNVTIGTSTFSLSSSGTNYIKVIDRSWDHLDFYADLLGPSAIGTQMAGLELSDQSGTALSSDALPTSIDFSDFNSPRRLILGNSDSDFFMNGSNLTKFQPVSPVPEPSTIVLMGLGLVGLAGYGRKKFKK